MRKIVALALPLVFLSLITVQANAVITPVEVERAKDLYFIRMRGDHQTTSFLFHYVNLSPNPQTVAYKIAIRSADGLPIKLQEVPPSATVFPNESWDFSFTGGVYIGYGYTMSFGLYIDGVQMLIGSVVIPPPP